MDATSARLLDGFAGPAHRDLLDPADWGRFHTFILDAYERDVPIGLEEIYERLAAARFSEALARDLAIFYQRARTLLEHRDDRVI